MIHVSNLCWLSATMLFCSDPAKRYCCSGWIAAWVDVAAVCSQNATITDRVLLSGSAAASQLDCVVGTCSSSMFRERCRDSQVQVCRGLLLQGTGRQITNVIAHITMSVHRLQAGYWKCQCTRAHSWCTGMTHTATALNSKKRSAMWQWEQDHGNQAS